ncbi:asparagine synthase (glutamine-hydrolyzing) [Marinobacter sp. KMM 10035]|uniref:asparagine synthase (glutamine-hydrolyzing) n=1 Tax=Marinobacter sp. KMM 10035 TaxID=3134034 RepID=UPI00397CDD4C
MCGIVGQVVHSKISQSQDHPIFQSLKVIGHRGPDGYGTFFDPKLVLGHVRLSVLDLTDAAKQPMISRSGRFVISYNGEVYNFQELRERFSLNHLRTHSDTEVIIELFSKIGKDCFRLLNGMFSLAIFDVKERILWLARDRLGIKPLYLAKNENGLFFSSEIKGIHALENSFRGVNAQALAEWSYYGNGLGEKTLFKGVTKLLPGHYLKVGVDNINVEEFTYWEPGNGGLSEFGDLAVQARSSLERAVRRQLVSDVPVGVFLSGGIDSSAIAAFASKYYPGKLATFSAGFDYDKGVNELPQAKRLAERYGTDHHEIHIVGADVADTVEKMVWHHDQPFSDAANIPLYLISQQVGDRAKVILQGDGGDELFGGYKRYATLSRFRQMKILARIARAAQAALPKNSSHHVRQRYINALLANPFPKVMALLLTVEDEAQSPLKIFQDSVRKSSGNPFERYFECASKFAGRSPVDQMLLVDSMIILPDIFLEKVDRSTMASSLEVRVPFLDNDLVEFCQGLPASRKIPGGKQKDLLKRSLKGVVPDEVLHGKKTGFGVPFSFWLEGPLKDLFFDHIGDFIRRQPYVLDQNLVYSLFDDHIYRRKDNGFLLWKIMNLVIWSNRYNVDWSEYQ